MAGAILIDDKSGVSWGSFTFDFVLAAIRKQLDAQRCTFVETLWEPYEDGFMFISLKKLSGAEYRQVLDATIKASEDEISMRISADMAPVWGELLDIMRSDPRAELNRDGAPESPRS